MELLQSCTKPSIFPQQETLKAFSKQDYLENYFSNTKCINWLVWIVYECMTKIILVYENNCLHLNRITTIRFALNVDEEINLFTPKYSFIGMCICLFLFASTGNTSITLISIISTSFSIGTTFIQSWYHDTSHLTFDLLCLRERLPLQDLSLCELVSLEIVLTLMLTSFRYKLGFSLSLPSLSMLLGDFALVLFWRLPLFLWQLQASFCVRDLPRFGETGDSCYCWNVTLGVSKMISFATLITI